MLVVLTDQVFPDADLEAAMLTAAGHRLEVAGSSAELEDLLPRADAILTAFLPMPADVISSMRNAKIIARYGIGVDNVDLVAAAARGITVTNVPDYCVEEVATHTVGMLLALVRKLREAEAHLRAGGWGVSALGPMPRLSEMTVGLVGIGRIGTLVCHTLQPLGPRLIAFDPFVPSAPDGVELVSLPELLASSDAVLLHAPLTSSTRHLIDASAIASMKPTAVVVNAARGGLVDLAAVTGALREGRLGGAALDVFEREPLSLTEIEGVPGLYVSPHVAYYSGAAVRESQTKATTQVIKVLAGQAPDYPVRTAVEGTTT
jgi:D-3-phosphoglycerate dehydrogenase